MANPLFNQMQPQNDLVSSLNALRSNPLQFLMSRKMNIPQNLQNDPNAIIQHLLNTGQVTQEQYSRAERMARQFKR